MHDIDYVELSYQATINKLENELSKLRKDKERLDWLMEVMEALQEHLNRIQRENAELRKDKERLDWVLSHEGRYWLSFREDIDKEMEESQ